MLTIKGTCMGTRTRNSANKTTGEIFVSSVDIGISIAVPDGFDGQTDTFVVRLTRKQLQSGVQALYEKLRGQDITVAVNPQLWATDRGDPRVTWYAAGEGRPSNLPDVKPLSLNDKAKTA